MVLVAGRVSYASNMGHFNLVTNVQRTIHDLLSFTWVSVIFVMEAKISVAAPAHLLARIRRKFYKVNNSGEDHRNQTI